MKRGLRAHARLVVLPFINSLRICEHRETPELSCGCGVSYDWLTISY